jgi:hypothetical protein
VIVDRDNDSAPGANAEDENLMPAWAKAEKSESEVEKPAPDVFQSSEEPQRGLEPLRIGLIEDRFDDLSGKKLMKEEKIVQRYRFSPRPAVFGLVVGLAASLEAGRLMRDLLYEIKPLDPVVYAAVAAFACIVPAWRASRLDPMQALRSE